MAVCNVYNPRIFAVLRPIETIPDVERLAKRLLYTSAAGARARRLTHSLTIHSVLSLIERAGGRCELSGIPFIYGTIEGKRNNPYKPSIDRISSCFGYTVDNCRLVLLGVNLARNEFGDEFFTQMLKGCIDHGVLSLRQ